MYHVLKTFTYIHSKNYKIETIYKTSCSDDKGYKI